MEGIVRKLKAYGPEVKIRRIFDYLVARPTMSAFLAVLMLASVATAGSLTPPASPASTFFTLDEIYDAIASDSFDSSGFAATNSGSLINHLLYIEQNLGWASTSPDIYTLNSGNVGIGDSTPEVKFEVVGGASISGTLFANGGCVGCSGVTSNSLDFDEFVDAMTLDANLTIASGGFTWDFTDINIEGAGTASLSNVFSASSSARFVRIGDAVTGQGSSSPTSTRNPVLEIGKTFTSTIGATALNLQALWDFGSGAGGINGIEVNTQTAETNTNNMTGTLTGIISRAEHGGSGTANSITGVSATGNNRGGGAVTTATGVYGSAVANAGTVFTARSIVGENLLLTSGVVSRSYSILALTPNIFSGTVINAAGLVSEEIVGATNNTNLLLGTTTIPSGSYSIYNASTRPNYFGGNASIAGNFEVDGTIYANSGCVGCGGVSSNSLDFDEFVDAMTLDADTTISNNGFALTIGRASISSNLEISGIGIGASISGTTAAIRIPAGPNDGSSNALVLGDTDTASMFVRTGGFPVFVIETDHDADGEGSAFIRIGDNATQGVFIDENTTRLYEFRNSSGAGTSSLFFGMGATTPLVLDAMDGSDTTRMIQVNLTNANHTGTGNFLYGMDIGSIIADADATEIGLQVGSGWDYGASFSTNLFVGGSASVSNNLELFGYASVSQLFVNGTQVNGGAGVTSNSLDFDEFVDAMTLDANLTIASAGFTVNWEPYFTSSLSPSVDDTYSLGRPDLRWRDLYVGPGTIHIGSSGAEGCFRYTGSQLEFADDCSSFSAIAGGSSGGWTDDGVVVRLTTATDDVGIGTTSPASKLDVADTNAAGYLTLSRLDTSVVTGDDIGTIDFWNNDSDLTTQNIVGRILIEADSTFSTDAAPGRMLFYTTGTTVGGSPVERMRIDSSGLIGMGTSGPTARLDIVRPSGTAGTDDLFRIASGSTEHLIVQNDGNVGIGDSTPDFVLAVNGVSHTEGAAVFYGNTGIGQNTSAWGGSAYENVSDANKAVLSIMDEQFADESDITFEVGRYSTPYLRIRGDGTASLSGTWESNGTFIVNDGSRTAPSIRFDTNGVYDNRGIYYNTAGGYDTINIVGEDFQHAQFDVADGSICFISDNANPICDFANDPKLYVEGIGSNAIAVFASANNNRYFGIGKSGAVTMGSFENDASFHQISTNTSINPDRSEISALSDLFILGDLEVDGLLDIGTLASIGGNAEFAGSFVKFPNGSAAAPSITFSSDPDTGIDWVSANVMRFSTGGTEAARIDANQNLVIGTITTLARLTVEGLSGNNQIVSVASANGSEVFSIEKDGDVIIGGLSTPLGNVGIGTSNTAGGFATIQGLTTGGASAPSDVALLIENSSGTDRIWFFTGGGASFSDGLEISSGVVKTANGSAAAPVYSFVSDPDIGMYRITTNTLGFSTNGAEVMRLDSSGDAAFSTGVLQVSGTTFVTYNRLGTNTTGHSLNASEDLLITDDLEVDGTIFADGGITMGANIDLNGNSITGGGSFGGSSVSVTGGGSFGASISAVEFLAGNGSAGAPSYTFTGDETTGMFRSGASVRLTAGGTEIGNFSGTGLDVTGTIESSGGFIDAGNTGVDRTCAGGETLNGITTSGGIVTAGTCTTNASDYTERFFMSDRALQPGDVVAADPAGSVQVGEEVQTYNQGVVRSTTPYQGTIVGIYSGDPGLIIGPRGTPEHPTVTVALAGRVHVRVRGDVKAGDMLTSSELPGVAMKATQAGMVVGMALDEPFASGSETYVMTFVNPQYWAPYIGSADLSGLEEFGITESFVRSLFDAVVALFSDLLGITFEHGKIATDKAEFGEVKTDVLCLDDLCVTKDELRELLNTGDIEPLEIPNDTGDEDITDDSGSSGSGEGSSVVPDDEQDSGSGDEESEESEEITDNPEAGVEEVNPEQHLDNASDEEQDLAEEEVDSGDENTEDEPESQDEAAVVPEIPDEQ